MVNNRFSK